MKCSWQTFLSPLKGQCPYQALLGLPQTTRFTGGFDCLFNVYNKRADTIRPNAFIMNCGTPRAAFPTRKDIALSVLIYRCCFKTIK
ncbi:MAG: hypothetical protein VZR24_22605, partial [Butyrivibrio hungatei]|nr:hypothetical protein [Butyrivibrio hungatei]